MNPAAHPLAFPSRRSTRTPQQPQRLPCPPQRLHRSSQRLAHPPSTGHSARECSHYSSLKPVANVSSTAHQCGGKSRRGRQDKHFPTTPRLHIRFAGEPGKCLSCQDGHPPLLESPRASVPGILDPGTARPCSGTARTPRNSGSLIGSEKSPSSFSPTAVGMRQACDRHATGMRQECDRNATGMRQECDRNATGLRQDCGRNHCVSSDAQGHRNRLH
jgi:hypothetical protein